MGCTNSQNNRYWSIYQALRLTIIQQSIFPLSNHSFLYHLSLLFHLSIHAFSQPSIHTLWNWIIHTHIHHTTKPSIYLFLYASILLKTPLLSAQLFHRRTKCRVLYVRLYRCVRTAHNAYERSALRSWQDIAWFTFDEESITSVLESVYKNRT
jgi:hypothetical protein